MKTRTRLAALALAAALVLACGGAALVPALVLAVLAINA